MMLIAPAASIMFDLASVLLRVSRAANLPGCPAAGGSPPVLRFGVIVLLIALHSSGQGQMLQRRPACSHDGGGQVQGGAAA